MVGFEEKSADIASSGDIEAIEFIGRCVSSFVCVNARLCL